MFVSESLSIVVTTHSSSWETNYLQDERSGDSCQVCDSLSSVVSVDINAFNRLACKECRKQKPSTQYSGKQLGDLQQHLYKSNRQNAAGAADYVIRCRICTPGVNTELHCMICGEVKALEFFSKTHRSSPDTAVSLSCSLQIDLILTKLYSDAFDV